METGHQPVLTTGAGHRLLRGHQAEHRHQHAHRAEHPHQRVRLAEHLLPTGNQRGHQPLHVSLGVRQLQRVSSLHRVQPALPIMAGDAVAEVTAVVTAEEVPAAAAEVIAEVAAVAAAGDLVAAAAVVAVAEAVAAEEEDSLRLMLFN